MTSRAPNPVAPQVVFTWARAVEPGLRIFATLDERGERIVLTKLGDEVLTARDEEGLAALLTEKICARHGWVPPGGRAADRASEAEVARAMAEGNKDFARALGRELALSRESGGRLPALARGRMGAEGWRRSAGPRPEMLGAPRAEDEKR